MIRDDRPLVMHVIHRLDFGGLENGLVNLVNRMPEQTFRHAIVALSGVNATFATRIRRNDVEVLSLGKRAGKDVRAYATMFAAIRRARPAILHTRNLGTIDMQWVAALAGVPFRIHGEHGWEAGDPQGRSPKSLRIRRACRPVIHRYVPMSRDIARWLGSCVGVDASRIRQLYSGVDTERFGPGPGAAGGSPDASLTVGTVGRLDPVKHQAALVRALASLRPSYPHLRLLIVGDGPERVPLASLAQSLGMADAVEFTGPRLDIEDSLRRMDVFVLPSINEGISNTILEAMATGLPVVAGRVGGNPELVVDGVTGTLYDPGDGGGLVSAVSSYLADPDRRRQHGRAGRERVVQNFSLEAMVQRYQALYEELFSSASRRRRGRPGVGVEGS
jgi:sugar transferase (PEP-CTERM/EpsH1 system associated)